MLIVILVVGSAIGASNNNKSAVSPGMLAVIVPTADASRTVVVAPCGTGTRVASDSAGATKNTVGAITLELPRGLGTRVVLVPKCTGARGGVAGSSYLPSAAFVTQAGTALPPVGSSRSTSSSSSQAGAPGSAQLQAIVPSASPIRTIVVTPCEKAHPTGPAERILSPHPGSSTAIAPPC